MATNTGKNLLSPGKTPKTNLQFLTFFINTVKAFHDNADLLRATIASAGNDHRLGANEAPPAIMSVFLGSQLSSILDELERKVKGGKMSADEKTALKLNIIKVPDILLDNTDRNRTSPFAFTGNKFEFRAVGSSANCSGAMTVLNTIMANQLIQFKKDVDALIAKGKAKDEAIFNVLRDYIVESKRIRFEGNGYGEEWVKEAKKRGLNNFKTTPEALEAWMNKKFVKMFDSLNVLSEREQHARYEIYLETYVKKIQIESRVLGDLARAEAQVRLRREELHWALREELVHGLEDRHGLRGDEIAHDEHGHLAARVHGAERLALLLARVEVHQIGRAHV